MGSSIFQGNAVKLLKNSMLLGSGATISSGSLNPMTSGFAGATGDIYLSTSTGLLYQKTGAGDTDWDLMVTSSTLPPIIADFGDGSDGDVTLTGGTTTLTRNMYYNNLTLTSSAILRTGGFRIYVKNTLTVDVGSTIHRNGGNGENGSGITGGNNGVALGFSAFGLGSGINGVSGSNGATTSGTAGTVGQSPTGPSLGGTGGTSGAGGNGASGTGGVGRGAATVTSAGGYRSATDTAFILPMTASTFNVVVGGASGSGGGGGAGDTTNSGGGGGGGGAGGGGVMVRAKTIVNNGTISSNGGNGGNGATRVTGNVGGGGAGGGGGGGFVVVVYDSLSGSGTITASGGSPGTPGNGVGTGLIGGTGGSGGAGAVHRYNTKTRIWDQ